MPDYKTANITFEGYARCIKEDEVNPAKFFEKWHIFGTSDNQLGLKSVNKGCENANKSIL